MADSIPRAYLKELTDTLAAESLNVALFTTFTNYYQSTTTTYALLAAGGGEVANGNGYITGGVALTGKTSSNYGNNGAMLTANASVFSSATFSCRYAVIYNSTTGKIRFVKDLLETKSVTGGTMTITWNATSGIFNFIFTEA